MTLHRRGSQHHGLLEGTSSEMLQQFVHLSRPGVHFAINVSVALPVSVYDLSLVVTGHV